MIWFDSSLEKIVLHIRHFTFLFCFHTLPGFVLFNNYFTYFTFSKKKGVKVADKLLLTQELEYM